MCIILCKLQDVEMLVKSLKVCTLQLAATVLRDFFLKKTVEM